MFEVFKYVDKFFTSLTNYLTYNDIFLIFVGLFIFTIICVSISTANSYESKLIKAVDKFNAYFIDNPQINEENLVAFNQKMKARFVPKQLRKSWQQYVLYRENKASAYMSFENCVSNPIKNSSYKRDTKLMNILAYIFAACALILNCYYCFETSDLASVLSSVLLTPVIILLLNYILQIFFNVKHSAIVSDLFQNYQYFEVNIDKATETLPEYVDYEVLFDRNEIKRGIPILYAYLQKRAEEEQRELERARLKNVEHEKFNFDDAGIEASLVLERAMQEAENYIAERKKYVQDTGQINSDITQEDMNYREITKEYNRQMQVSKETFANFKAQLEEASSSIEANYIKKQQQQELDRQRNLERDFDTATERHKKIIENYQAELDTVDKFIAESRKNLETAMKSEFSTYSSKVYDAANKIVEEKQKEKYNKLKDKINELEEELIAKNKELSSAYEQNQVMTEQLEKLNVLPERPKENPIPAQPVEIKSEYADQSSEPVETNNKQQTYEQVEPNYEEPYQEGEPTENYNYDQPVAEPTEEYEDFADEPIQNFEEGEPYEEYNYDENIQNEVQPELVDDELIQDENEPEYLLDGDQSFEEEYVQPEQTEEAPQETFEEDKDDQISTDTIDDSITNEVKPAPRRGRPKKVVVAEQIAEKRSRGRPRKQVVETEEKPKRKVGRPKKVQTEVNVEHKKGRGRPRKIVANTEVQKSAEPKRKIGRPRKTAAEKEVKTEVTETKRGRGRPKKVATEAKPIKKGRGRPKKVENKEKEEVKFNKMDNIVDIDEYIKQIDNAIAEENAKLEETQKELVKNAKLRRKK